MKNFEFLDHACLNMSFNGFFLTSLNLLKYNFQPGASVRIPFYLNVSATQNVFQQHIDYKQFSINSIIDPTGGNLNLIIQNHTGLFSVGEIADINLVTAVTSKVMPFYRDDVVDLMGTVAGSAGINLESDILSPKSDVNSAVVYLNYTANLIYLDGNILNRSFDGINSNILTYFIFEGGIIFSQQVVFRYNLSYFLENYGVNDFSGTRSHIGFVFSL